MQLILLLLGDNEERNIQDFGGETWGKETTWKTQA